MVFPLPCVVDLFGLSVFSFNWRVRTVCFSRLLWLGSSGQLFAGQQRGYFSACVVSLVVDQHLYCTCWGVELWLLRFKWKMVLFYPRSTNLGNSLFLNNFFWRAVCTSPQDLVKKTLNKFVIVFLLISKKVFLHHWEKLFVKSGWNWLFIHKMPKVILWF
jgi:hypothetical protein